MKWFSIVFVIVTMTGCLTGRSWDTPGKETVQNSLPNLSRLTLYIDGDVDLIRRAMNEVPLDVVDLKIAEKSDNLQTAFPLIKVQIQPPGWRNNWFTNTSAILSGFTISIIPGYMYQASELSFQLTLPNKAGTLTTTDYAYAAKRHYVSWLPLWVVGNFTQTVQVWTEPKLDWDMGYKHIVQQFFRDAKPAFGEYRAWLDRKSNTSSK